MCVFRRISQSQKKKDEEAKREEDKQASNTSGRVMLKLSQYRYDDESRAQLAKNVKGYLRDRAMGHRRGSSGGMSDVTCPNLIQLNKTSRLAYQRQEVRAARVEKMASDRNNRMKEVKSRRDEASAWRLQAKKKLVTARSEAHEMEMKRRRQEQEAEVREWRLRTLFPMLSFCGRFSVLSNVLTEDRRVRFDRARKKRAVLVIVRTIRRKMRAKKLALLKVALPKMRACLRDWIRRTLQKRREKAATTLIEFAKSVRSIGDVPLAINKYLRHVRVLQRTIRSHFMRINCITAIRMEQMHAHERKLEKEKKRVSTNQGKKDPNDPLTNAEKRKLKCEFSICHKHLRKSMQHMGHKLFDYRAELVVWKKAKEAHDQIEAARSAVMGNVGIKDVKREFKKRPGQPWLRIHLTQEEVKQYLKEASKLERAGIKEKEDKKSAEAAAGNAIMAKTPNSKKVPTPKKAMVMKLGKVAK